MTFCSTSKCSLPGANEKSSLVQLTEAAFFQQKYIKILRAVFIMEVTNISPEKLESASGNQSWLAGKIPPSIDDFPIKHPNRFSQIVSHEAPFFQPFLFDNDPIPSRDLRWGRHCWHSGERLQQSIWFLLLSSSKPAAAYHQHESNCGFLWRQ